MIQPKPSRSRKSSFARRHALFSGAAAVLFASSIASWGCSDGAVPPPPGTGGTPATGGTSSTGGVMSTGGTTGGTTGGVMSTGGTTGGTAPSTGGMPATGGAAVVPDCVKTALTAKCTTACHNMTNAPFFGGLDLTNDFVPRLLDKNATFMGTGTPIPASCPTGIKLIDSATPANSWFLKKINGDVNMCGTSMPQGGTLTPDEKTCFETWIQTF
jgi:hypothetical protein